MQPAESQLVPNLLRFHRALRRLGVGTTSRQVRDLIAGLEHLDLEDREEVRDGARAVLVGRREEAKIFDRLFDLFFAAGAAAPDRRIDLGRTLRRVAEAEERRALSPGAGHAPEDAPVVEGPPGVLRLGHSDVERLRFEDFARLADDERRLVLEYLRRKVWEPPPRRRRRFRAASAGRRPDLRRTLRESLRRGAEPVVFHRRQRRRSPRPLVVLCDISGSMEAYSRIFLQFLYSLRTSTDRLEAFVFATRLTRITRELRHRDVDRALAEASAKVVDWGGGTRIGEAFATFHRRWSRRVLGRGAVVAVLSDAWDRGDPDLLERQAARLARTCHRLLWLNPLVGSEGFRPVASGIRTVLPHVDHLLPVHDLHSLEQLADAFAEI